MCGVRVNVGVASIGINLELSRGSLSIVSVVTSLKWFVLKKDFQVWE